MNEDDVVTVGKLRRPGLPSAAVSYDPGHGIRVEGEDVPPDPDAAAAWLRRNGGWLRLRRGAAKASPEVARFVKAWRTARPNKA